MIAGSGPTDRNSDSTIPGVKPGSFRLLADDLERQGIPSLRFDKRSIGASAGAARLEADLRFDDFVRDAADWAAFLGSRPGVTCVVIFGHSEGALIGAAIASHVPVCGPVEASGVGRPMDAVVEAQVAAAGAPSEVQDQVQAIYEALKQGRTVDSPPKLRGLFRPPVQPYLISALRVRSRSDNRARAATQTLRLTALYSSRPFSTSARPRMHQATSWAM
ncbi:MULTISPECIES: alpha/beta hydrolase [Sphingosinicellaceae]|uniref:alpha/beta hydrolase n=1 Tax=Sphingosinicellaceae TaxID=2820280 RepID=UPI001C1E2890|nr:lysophospholipase [Polymorphobacter sp. PAMC 29334]UAJ12826.1 lysophospholipase [Polymorphobacter megasporae]